MCCIRTRAASVLLDSPHSDPHRWMSKERQWLTSTVLSVWRAPALWHDAPPPQRQSVSRRTPHTCAHAQMARLRLELVAVGLAAEDLLREELAHDGNTQGQGDVGLQEVGLGLHAGHDLGPLGHHGVTLALHLGGHSVQQNGVPASIGQDSLAT